MASPADIKSIFLAATEKPLPERAAFLNEVCGDDSALRQRVEALLKAHDNTGGWLGEGATPTSDYPGFTAPSIGELAPHFPQLEILELLGQGGMGAVYKARQKNLDRLVALKILPHDAGDRGFAERFTREARTLAKLNHPGIVAVHDFGSSGELYWFVMEFVDGVNLRQARKAGTLTPVVALAVVPKICEALQFAHDAGIVHRDIKPENVLLDAKGRVKIADFGLAKLVGRPDRSHLTGTNQAMGTPHYMAPEQWEKPLEVDHRADIYSLGVVFYELLTGELPLGRFAPPSEKVQIDVRLDEVVLRTLEKEPARRYQQASEVKTAVERISFPGPAQPSKEMPEKAGPSRWWSIWILMGILVIGTIVISAANGPGSQRKSWISVGEFQAGVATLSVLFLLIRRAARRRGQSVVRFCRLDSATTWAIIVCVFGIANAFSPWIIVSSNSRQAILRGAVPPHYSDVPLISSSLFAIVGLILFVFSPWRRSRPWSAGLTVIAGMSALIMSLELIFDRWDGPIEVMRMNLIDMLGLESTFQARAAIGPYIAAGLGAVLLVIGAIDLRGWLTSESSRLPAEPATNRSLQPPVAIAAELGTPSFRTSPSRTTFFRAVVKPLLLAIIFGVLVPAGLLFSYSGWDRGVHDVLEVITVVAACLAPLLFVVLLIRWSALGRQQSVSQRLNEIVTACHLNSPTFWAIVVCLLGIANAFLPWTIMETR